MRPVVRLARLNEIDIALDLFRARLLEIQEALKEPAELQAARQLQEQAAADLARAKATQTDRELAQRRAAQKLADTEQHLYSGKVRQPKELQDLALEVQMLKRQAGQIEEELLQALIAHEAASETYDRCVAEYRAMATAWQARQADLRAELVDIKQRVGPLLAEQASARRSLPPDLLSTYDGLRARRGGRAVSKVDRDECSACRVALPPGKLAAARDGDDLVYCGTCGRLLWDE